LVVAALVGSAACAQDIAYDINQIQRALVHHGYNIGSVDGLWGRRSINALAAFQKAHGLRGTGELNDVTVKKLLESSQPQAATPALPPTTLPAIGTPSPISPLLPILAPPQAVMVEPPQLSEPTSHPPRPAVPSAVISPPKVMSMSISSQSLEAIRAGALAAGAVAIAIAVMCLFVRRRRTAQIVQNASASSTAHISIATNTRLSPPPTSKSSGAHPEVNQPIKPLTSNVQISPDLTASIAAHNAKVEKAITARLAEDAGLSAVAAAVNLENSNKSSSLLAKDGTQFIALKESLAAHNASVEQAIRDAHQKNKDRSFIEPPTRRLIPNGLISPDIKASTAAHNAAVGKAITARLAEDAGLSAVAAAVNLENSNKNSSLLAKDGTQFIALKESLAAHNASVEQAIRDAHQKNKDQPFIEHPARRSSQDDSLQFEGWIPANQSVTVGNHVIPGGLIYVGNRLPQTAHVHRAENCLINPRLAIASRGDPGGHTMGSWPSYSEITAEARRSYLDWLAGSRSDPSTYIGYVFLYFYGLERRLMLEKGAPDASLIIAEVRRLMRIYGSHSSFHRYAQELLSAYELQEAREPETVVPGVDANGYEVPLSIKAALGARVRDGQPIEADLLLAYAMSHPETSVRTPAKRALNELRQLFAQELSKRHPAGFVISASRAKKLMASYRACSGTFEVEIRPYGGELPDISGYGRLLNVGRELLESCTAQLEDYSRALGRASGPTPTLAVLSRLPSSLRRQHADLMAAASMKTLDSLCDNATPSDPEQLLSLVGAADGTDVNRAKLRELAGILAAFGYGITADPTFAVRTTKTNEPVVVFRLGCPVDASTNLAPTPRYAQVQATLMLALLVATADGTLDDRERQGLMARVDAATELPEAEKRRLAAELMAQASTPGRVTDWMKRLKDLEATDSERVADILVAAAAADGRIDPSEVTLLEKVFARLGLEASALYTRLHGSIAAPTGGPDDDLKIVLPAGKAPKTAFIPPPLPADGGGRAVRVDLSRLEAIRRETRSASNVLADIFAEEEDTPEPEAIAQDVPDPAEDAIFEGLEGRYGCLLADLAERDKWTSADFEQLTRRAGLMPAAARQVLNEWSFDRFDEPVLEGEDVIIVNRYLLPQPSLTSPSVSFVDSRASA
jgi:tellurite resistance protein